jgi:hypothetical protein
MRLRYATARLTDVAINTVVNLLSELGKGVLRLSG